MRDNIKDKRAIYLSAEKFMFQFVKAIRERDMVSFKEYLRTTDILLIDGGKRVLPVAFLLLDRSGR